MDKAYIVKSKYKKSGCAVSQSASSALYSLELDDGRFLMAVIYLLPPVLRQVCSF